MQYVLFIVLGALLSHVNPGPPVAPDGIAKGAIVHNVYFWLNDNVSADDRDAFAESLRSLKQIKAADEIVIGTPAGFDRAIVDNSFDFSLIVHFKNAAAHDRYQEDPHHLSAVQKMTPMIKEVLVYDTVVE